MLSPDMFSEVRLVDILSNLHSVSTVDSSVHMFSEMSNIFRVPDLTLLSKLCRMSSRPSESMLVDATDRLIRLSYVLK